MKYCDDCTSATWCYDQGKCDRAMVTVSESALESIKAMCERLQQERDELLEALKAIHFGGRTPNLNLRLSDQEMASIANAAIAKFTQEQPVSDWQERMK